MVAKVAASGSGKVLPEAGCEDTGLSVEVWDGAVIPNYVVCFLNLLTEVELGFNYPLCEPRGKPAVAGQAGKLGVAVACYDDDSVKLPAGPCFIEQGDVDQEPFASRQGGLGERGPAGADDGMEDVFKGLAPVFIIEDERAQPGTVGAAGFITGFATECRDDRITDTVIVREQVMHATVGIEMFHRQLLAQAPGERAFSRGDAAGETDDRHSLRPDV